MFYINPNYYGFSSSAKTLLADYVPCDNSADCYLRTGDYALKTFNFDDVRPYMHISVRITIMFVGHYYRFIPDITSYDSYIFVISHI